MRVREMSANAIFYNVRGQLAGLRTFRKLYECNGYPKVSDFGIFAFYAPVRKKKQAAVKPFASFLTFIITIIVKLKVLTDSISTN